jgi:hypothetical protein
MWFVKVKDLRVKILMALFVIDNYLCQNLHIFLNFKTSKNLSLRYGLSILLNRLPVKGEVQEATKE